MAETIRFLQGDINAQADFSTPVFAMFRDPEKLHANLLTRLSPLGLRLGDMRLERGNGSLDDIHLLCLLGNSATSVRVRLQRVEISCSDTSRVTGDQLQEIVRVVLDIVEHSASPPAYRTYLFAANLHGTLTTGTAKDFLARFSSHSRPALGPIAGSGTVFYYGAEADRLISSVTVDLSALYAGGLFVRTSAVFDATKLSSQDFPNAAQRFFDEAVAQLGLSILRDGADSG